jgi:uncharacterized membrane protein
MAMSSFAWGALGALAVFVTAGVLRRVFWVARIRRWHGRGPAGVRFVAARIRATPEQEKVLATEAAALGEVFAAFRADAWSLRSELSALLSAEVLDAAALSSALDRGMARAGEVRTRLEQALLRVHRAIGPAQRAELANLVRGGHGRHRRFAC